VAITPEAPAYGVGGGSSEAPSRRQELDLVAVPMEPDQELVYGWLGLNPALLLDPSPSSDNLMVRVVRPGEDPELVLEDARQQLASSGSRRRRRGRGGSGEASPPTSASSPMTAYGQAANPYAQANVYGQANAQGLGRSDGTEREDITVTVTSPSREPVMREPAMVEVTPFTVDDFAPIPVLVGAGGIDSADQDERSERVAPARAGRSRARQAVKSRDGAAAAPAPVVIEGSSLMAADRSGPDLGADQAQLPLTVSITPDPVAEALPPVEAEAEPQASGEPRRRRRRSSAND
jgi:ribonuclease E